LLFDHYDATFFKLKKWLVSRVLPESPRWLLSQNRLDDAEVEIRKMARINGRQLPANYFTDLKVRSSLIVGTFEIEQYPPFLD
jgi:hypothetical protein